MEFLEEFLTEVRSIRLSGVFEGFQDHSMVVPRSFRGIHKVFRGVSGVLKDAIKGVMNTSGNFSGFQ